MFSFLIIPEFFLLISSFILFIFYLFISTSEFYNYTLLFLKNLNCLIYIFFLSYFLFYNNIFETLFIFSGMFINNMSINMIKLFIILLVILIMLICKDYLIIEKINNFEFIIIIIFAVLGSLFLVSVYDVITTYLVIEVQSLSLYILLAFNKNTIFSTEAGIKYFIIGVFASIFLLLGFSFLYLGFGTLDFYSLLLLNIYKIKKIYYVNLILISLIFILISLLVKLGLFPFYMWLPDVYEGSLTNITIFMSIIFKLGVFIFLIRIFFIIFLSFSIYIQKILLLVGFFSVLIGSLLGIVQYKVKRLLIYSSLSNMGFIISAYSLGTFLSFYSAFMYLIVYFLILFNFWILFISIRSYDLNFRKMNLSIFFIDFQKTFLNNTVLKFLIFLNIMYLSGIPPFIGFFLKYIVFKNLIDSSVFLISILMIFFSAISIYFYLRLVKIMYFDNYTFIFSVISVIDKLSFLILLIFSFLLLYLVFNPCFIDFFIFKLVYFFN